jgi:putative membrane protein
MYHYYNSPFGMGSQFIYGSPWGILSMVLPFIFWIVIIVLLFSFFRGRHHMWHEHDMETHEDSALEILKIRYAKGEITNKQFDEMKKDIEEK